MTCMYEGFTDRARNVMVLANQEAQRFNHEYIGTEHILLGLIKEGSGAAAYVLNNLGLDLRKVRLQVERLVQSGPDMVTMGKRPQTPRAKKVIECAMKEARNLDHNYVGTEHLLLGLMREEEGVAAQVLLNSGLEFDAIRNEIITLLASGRIAPEPVSVGIFQKFIRRLFEKPDGHTFALAPRISKQAGAVASLVAIDIGNSQMKLGRFARDSTRGYIAETREPAAAKQSLPDPLAALELPIVHETGLFDLKPLAEWCEKHLSADTHWAIGSVHRGAGELLAGTIAAWTKKLEVDWTIHQISYRDLRIEIRVDEPPRVGIDRLLAAVAANCLRSPDRAAIVVDLGTAITVDLVEADGAFAGGAILPGIGMAGRALADQTDALPHVVLAHSVAPPSPLGKSTKAAIEAGLYWGAVGAVSELVSQLTARLQTQPDVFITGGASRTIADSMKEDARVQYVPHLVLAGIALLDEATPGKAGG
jgi:pantothenate kinase type III